MKAHVVQAGDCLSTIAHRHGFSDWKKIWDDPANDALRKLRKTPNVLYAGDVVHVPDHELKNVSIAVDAKHTFKVKRPTVRLKLEMQENDEAIANEPFRIEVGSRVIEGTTDSNGGIDVEIPTNAAEGTLVFAERDESYALKLGHLDPIREPTGVQARLRQLGFYVGAVDGDLGAFTQAALAHFQFTQGLTPTGQLDDATEDALSKAYGC